ncbi:hypothetical protein H310_11553 [Aphanomyces invadans]|uniref:N-acetyltransferase domain-containing protein n=1 Tax=Aphanomyces invadans TaxID=157072 RepID=A0A024TNM4_9STRA|nr:hypothetical protein H310_11553 [Aphanomyces invadans]ETV94902.1 hypothetical protein H310_11553 [Aphanomyces invadans]|eukprot:XP_008876493.1 hypothetical protein H310_11553 [Aphanomyces invadans]
MHHRDIVFGSREYEMALALREDVLRKPLGLQLDRSEVVDEATDIHLGMFSGDELVAYCMLRPAHPLAWMKQVVVKPAMQRHGIGRVLCNAFKARAIKEGFQAIHLHARDAAVPFYLKLEFTAVGNETFTEFGETHWHMHMPIVQNP